MDKINFLKGKFCKNYSNILVEIVEKIAFIAKI